MWHFFSYFFFFLSTLQGTVLALPTVSVTAQPQDATTSTLTVTFALPKQEVIYANTLNLVLNAPDIDLSPWLADKQPITHSNTNLPDVPAYTGTFTMTAFATRPEKSSTTDGTLHISYANATAKQIVEQAVPVSLFPQERPAQTVITAHTKQSQKGAIEHTHPTAKKSLWQTISSLGTTLQNALKKEQPLWLRLLFVFLLGLLMSLTPCIYPMLPITAGVLQTQGSKSLWRSFALAFTYTLGTSTTFAAFGLTAALTGHLFGQLLSNPVFVLFIVSLLAYLGFSMFGMYEIHIPRFLQGGAHNGPRAGSFLSIFIFGVIGGSVASPCLSPGLALLLTLVASMGSKLLGFILLFTFGLGLSVPLLIIGTFSSSLSIIPRAGSWMVEVKKIFGFMLLGMCFYFLRNIFPIFVLWWIATGLLFFLANYYLYTISRHDSKYIKWLKTALSFLLVIATVLAGLQGVYTTFYQKYLRSCAYPGWESSYEIARKKAQEANKPLLIDCGAAWCSICKAIDKYIFEADEVKAELCGLVAVKVDATDQTEEPYPTLSKQYAIIGVPTILLINPHTGALLQKWGSELYSTPRSEFISELQKHSKQGVHNG